VEKYSPRRTPRGRTATKNFTTKDTKNTKFKRVYICNPFVIFVVKVFFSAHSVPP
jgi:hypothetical protein